MKRTIGSLCVTIYFFVSIAALIILTDLLYETTQKASPKVLTMNVSAYCPCSKCCGDFADGITANGYVIQPGDKLIAAPKNYPFGTTMTIPGYGTAVVRDRGGSIKGNKLDLLFGSHQEALEWGRQHLEVTIHGK